tara:strand:- start:4267 stop:4377 length:111 start_codon:yes stop_codon:yes gene_type:complete
MKAMKSSSKKEDRTKRKIGYGVKTNIKLYVLIYYKK